MWLMWHKTWQFLEVNTGEYSFPGGKYFLNKPKNRLIKQEIDTFCYIKLKTFHISNYIINQVKNTSHSLGENIGNAYKWQNSIVVQNDKELQINKN